jgi:hypothetical protein
MLFFLLLLRQQQIYKKADVDTVLFILDGMHQWKRMIFYFYNFNQSVSGFTPEALNLFCNMSTNSLLYS